MGDEERRDVLLHGAGLEIEMVTRTVIATGKESRTV